MPPVDCPFQAADRILAAMPSDIRVVLVDFHAEATSDKQLMGRHLDGRVSAVLGTHTHVATADEQIPIKSFDEARVILGPLDTNARLIRELHSVNVLARDGALRLLGKPEDVGRVRSTIEDSLEAMRAGLRGDFTGHERFL